MAVRKFRSIEEMKHEPRWYPAGDPALFRALRRISEFARHTGAQRFPRGVHKHRTIEDMNRLTESWQLANFRAHQERRARESGSAPVPQP